MNRKSAILAIGVVSLLFGLWGFYSKNHPWYYAYDLELGALEKPLILLPLLLGVGSAIGLLLRRKWGALVFFLWPVAAIAARLTGASIAFMVSALVFWVIGLVFFTRPATRSHFHEAGGAK